MARPANAGERRSDERRVNLTIGVCVVLAVVTGLAANTQGTSSGRWLVVGHGVLGVALLVLTPAKQRIAARSLRRRRRRPGWRLSVVLAGLAVTTVASGLASATGLVRRVGPLTIMQVHIGAALAVLALAVVHYGQRPMWSRVRRGSRRSRVVRPAPAAAVTTRMEQAASVVPTTPPTSTRSPSTAVTTRAEQAASVAPTTPSPPTRSPSGGPPSPSRRHLLRSGVVAALAGVTWAGWERLLDASGAPGADRRFTGSHERSSGDPSGMPVTQWLDDRVQDVDPTTWRLTTPTRSWDLAALRALPQDDVPAVLDCTSLWWSEQTWRGVRLDRLLDPGGAASVAVTSRTGYGVRLPADEVDRMWLALEVGGSPLSAGHGFPARLVAPGRRGFWWVKWVERLEPSSVPWWVQSPFPLT